MNVSKCKYNKISSFTLQISKYARDKKTQFLFCSILSHLLEVNKEKFFILSKINLKYDHLKKQIKLIEDLKLSFL